MRLKSRGPEKASYSIVLFPVISVIVSSIYEGFEWNNYTIGGFILVGLGNVLMLIPDKLLIKIKSFFNFETLTSTASSKNQATG